MKILNKELEQRIEERTQELKESEEIFRSIAEQSLVGICIIQDNLIKYANQQCANMWGYTIEELKGWEPGEFVKLIHPEYREMVFGQSVKKQKGLSNVINQYQFRAAKKTGESFWVEIISNSILYKGKTAVLIMVIDSTEKKEAEQKLRESEKKYREILENIKEGYFEVDLNGNYTLVNDYFCKILGYTREELLGSNFRGIFDEKRSKEISKLYNQLYKNEISSPLVYERSSSLQSVETLYIETLADMKYDSEGNKVGFFGLIRDISERKEAEQKLKESEEKYIEILKNMMEGYFENDLKGNYTFVNDYFCKLLGYSKEEIIGMNYRLLSFDENKSKEVYKMFNQLYNNEISSPLLYEDLMLTKSGETIYYEALADVKYDSEGNKVGFFGFFRDITERKNAEQNLKDSEHCLSERVKELTSLYELSKLVITSDKSLEDIIYSVLNLIPPAFQFPDITTARIIYDDKVFSLENFRETEWKLTFKIDVNKILMSIEVAYLEKLPFAKEESDFLIEIGIRLKSIIEERETRFKLKESEEKFRTIADQSLIGINILQDDKIKYVNKALSTIIEYPIEEISNWNLQAFHKITHPEDLPRVYESIKKIQDGKTGSTIRYSCRITTKSKKIKWVEIFVKLILYQGKRAILASIIDITTQMEAEQKLKEINQMKSELLSRTSHELKTPLISIKGFSDLLLSQHYYKLDTDVISFIDEIKHGCVRLENLIKDILTTSELELGKTQLKTEMEDLSFLIKFSIREFRGLAEIRKQNINIDIHESLNTKFEKERIHEVLGNLITNAIKYTPPQGSIKVKTEIKDEFYIISVKDNGIGFTNEEKAKLFTQFGKIERFGQGLDVFSEGSGLGLYISKKIVELHGGKIWVESIGRNKGSTFYFSLPIINE